MDEEVKVRGIKQTSEGTNLGPRGLHGRKQIFTTEEITAANVVKVVNEAMSIHVSNRADEVYLEKYIRGYQPIMDRVKLYHNEINNKVVVNIANQIVTFKTAEFAGKPIQYVSRGSRRGVPKKIEKLNTYMVAEGKPSKDWSLAFKMFTCGVGYRLVLRDKAEAVAKGETDEAPFEVYTLDPQNSFVIRKNDVTRETVAGVNYVYITDNKVQYSVYTKDAMYILSGNPQRASKLEKVVTYNFGLVPMIEYPCNSLYMSPLEVVMSLLDAISSIQSNRLDGVEQFIQAIMVFEGVDITREDFMELKDLGAIRIPPSQDGKSSRVYYLNQQLDQTQTQTLIDDIYQTILEIVGMPSQGDGNSSDSSNNGAAIVKNGWWNAEARNLETIGMWTDAETQFLRIVLKICEEANVLTGLKLSDIESKFASSSYEDLLAKAQAFSMLIASNCPPIQAFKYSKLSQDPETDAAVFEAYQEEKAEKLDAETGVDTPDVNLSDEEEDDNTDTITGESGKLHGKGHPEAAYGVCPVCGRQFKKRVNNQRYDRDVCRRKAKEEGLDE